MIPKPRAESLAGLVPFAAYAALALAILSPLLGPGYYVALDMVFGPASFEPHQFPDFYGVAPSPYGAYFPLRMAMAALSDAIGPEAVEKLLLFAILFLCGTLMHHSLPSRLGNARYFGGLFYMLNAFVYTRFLAGHWSLLLSYAIWPLAIKCFSDFLERPKDRGAFAGAALATSFAAISSHGVFLLLLSYAILFAVRIAESSARMELLRRTAMLAAAVALMNLYWILPTLMLFNYSPAPAQAYLEEFGAKAADAPLPLALLSLHGFWRGGFLYTSDISPTWFYPLAILLAIAAIGLYGLCRDRKGEAAFFIILFAAAFILALGAESPAASIFYAIEKLLPVHLFLRDSQKFAGLLALVYSILGSYGLGLILSRLKGIAGSAVFVFVVALLLFHDVAFFGFLGQTGPTQYPKSWGEAEALMSADRVEGNILVLPMHLYSWYGWINGTQRTAGSPAGQFFSRRVITSTNIEAGGVLSDIRNPHERYLDGVFGSERNDTAELLLPLDIRYILLFKGYEDSPEYLPALHRLGGVPGISLIMETRSFYLFRNDLQESGFLATDDPGVGPMAALFNLTGKGMYSANVTFERTGPVSAYVAGSSRKYILTQSWGPLADFEGKKPFTWYGIARAFEFGGPGMLTNRMFDLTVGLFMLSWALAIALALNIWKAALPLVQAFALLHTLAVTGIAGTHALGWMLLITSLAVLFVVALKSETDKSL
ncbi:MAG: hypothetical protein AB1324_05005 [Candidatus Micrarchaeota archaeon]